MSHKNHWGESQSQRTDERRMNERTCSIDLYSKEFSFNKMSGLFTANLKVVTNEWNRAVQ